MKRIGYGLLLLLLIGLASLNLQATERGPFRTELPRTESVSGPFPPTVSAPDPAALTEEALDRYIYTYMQTKHIPGLSASLTKEGKILWEGTYGKAYLNPFVPVTRNTLFMLASISKTVTATAAMQLYEDGLFGLNDPVNNYLPFIVEHPIYPNTDITFLMLMTHTSGIRDNWNLMPYYPGDSPIPLGDYLYDYLNSNGSLYNPNLNFHSWKPGTNDSYCNIAVALVGYLVEVISGQPFDAYCQDNIFEPLEMNETAWFLKDLDPDHIAMPMFWSGGKYHEIGHYGYSDYPSGQLRTSPYQLLRFLRSYMQLGQLDGVRILERSTVDLMLTPQVPGISPGQGIIWYRWYNGGRALWGHNGGDQGVTTEMYFDPQTEIGLVLLTNGESGLATLVDYIFDWAETM